MIAKRGYLKKILALIFFYSLALTDASWAQSMSDQEVLRMTIKEKSSGTSDSDIVTRLIQNGATLEQIQRVRQQYEGQITQTGMDNAVAGAASRMRINNGMIDDATSNLTFPDANSVVQESLDPSGRRVFGRDIFNNKQLTFEPQMNIATPQNYVLGPGDQLFVDIYGASQENLSLTISPDGDITFPELGPVHVSGLTVADAQSHIRSEVGGYYSSSQIKISLGQTRTIMVNVMGEVNVPGTYSLSAFATVFHALYHAGGINSIGTLRNIKVFRHGRQISQVDVYEFILNGRMAGNVRLEDDDVIQVGTYESVVEVSGGVKRPMAYEMKSSESLATLLTYCGGFADNAYKKLVCVLRNEDMKSVYNVDESEFSAFNVADGDQVIVSSIVDRYKNMVEVQGAVFRPGKYQLGDKVNSVRSLVETASGLTEEAMSSHAIMRRLKANRTQEVLQINIEAIMNGTEPDIPLKNEDVLFIPTLAEHQNLRTFSIGGEVVFPGTYEYADNMSAKDLIFQAGGLTDAASVVKIDVFRRMHDADATEAGLDLIQAFSLSLKDNTASNSAESFILQPYDIVEVRKSPVFQELIRVNVDGEVAFPGGYAMEKKNQRLSDVINAAGGVIPGSNVRGARLVRKMTDDEKARMSNVIELARQTSGGSDSVNLGKIEVSETYTVGIHLDDALAHPGSAQDIELIDGDRLIVPRFNNTVRISGDVNLPNTVAFEKGKDYKYYIEQAGGFGDRAKKRNAYIIYQNGTMAIARKAKVESGCEIVVPSKPPRNPNSMSQWIGIGTSFTSLAAMIVALTKM
jgi:protein involved in polysaccharide export with SLBB domain